MKLPPEQRPRLEAFLRACRALRTEGIEKAARRSGSRLRGDSFQVQFLGRAFLLRVEPPSVEPEADDAEKACIARYVMLARDLRDRTPVSFADIPRARGYLAPFRGRVIAPFLAAFGRSVDEFSRAAAALGGKRAAFGGEAPAASGGEAWALRVFALVEISFVLWKGDDEFGPDATVLFPRGLFDVFEVEDAVVMADLASRTLRRAAR